MTNLTVYINCDTQDVPYVSSGVDWVEMDTANDKILFSAGSATVIDGAAIPSETELNQAGTVVSEIAQVIVSKYFLQDNSASIIKEIHNAGNQNKRYVFGFYFDAATVSEPVLELWDDSGLDSTDLYSLGDGTPTNSWWKGIVTTSGLPGADWAGSALAGSTNGHFLYLNDENGALAVATVLYCNLKIVIPINPTESGLDQPVFVVKYTSN